MDCFQFVWNTSVYKYCKWFCALLNHPIVFLSGFAWNNEYWGYFNFDTSRKLTDLHARFQPISIRHVKLQINLLSKCTIHPNIYTCCVFTFSHYTSWVMFSFFLIFISNLMEGITRYFSTWNCPKYFVHRDYIYKMISIM